MVWATYLFLLVFYGQSQTRELHRLSGGVTANTVEHGILVFTAARIVIEDNG